MFFQLIIVLVTGIKLAFSLARFARQVPEPIKPHIAAWQPNTGLFVVQFRDGRHEYFDRGLAAAIKATGSKKPVDLHYDRDGAFLSLDGCLIRKVRAGFIQSRIVGKRV